MSLFHLTVKALPGGNTFAGKNRVALSPADFDRLILNRSKDEVDPCTNVLIDDKFVYMAFPHAELREGEIGMNILMRKAGNYTFDSQVSLTFFCSSPSLATESISISIDFFTKKKDISPLTIDFEPFKLHFQTLYNNHVFFCGQKFICIYDKTNLEITVDALVHVSLTTSSDSAVKFGQYSSQGTALELAKTAGSPIFLNGNAKKTNSSLFKREFSFESLGIGGLDSQFSHIFKDVFASRLFPGLYNQLGFSHIKGLLLYGPPGCGKTLIARQIGKIINAKEPKIVNGPEILDKYVGGSEEKIRALFADAEKEQKERGDASDLHIIILDEMDAIMKSRGMSRGDTGVGDSIVNQFLSKIDGVDSLNNVLIIGMTNRKDLIDEAVLRPGRLEIHMEIGLPTELGRNQIITIKTKGLREMQRMTQEAIDRLPEIGKLTKNFTGAEIEGLCKRATNFALTRAISDPTKVANLDDSSVMVEFQDFIRAIDDSLPAFGNKSQEDIENCFKNGWIRAINEEHDRLWASLKRAAAQVLMSEKITLVTVLLEGDVACGKTAIAAKLAAESYFGFVRMVSADSMIGFSEMQVCSSLHKVFMDAYRSSSAIIFLDDIERIIQFTPVGQRFSNVILQTLLILLKKAPPSSTRLMIVATTAVSRFLEDLQLTTIFNIVLHVPQLEGADVFKRVLQAFAPPHFGDELIEEVSKSICRPIGLKQMLLVIEMAAASAAAAADGELSVDSFLECYYSVCR
jgi:vesicle-fusing ATPase